MWEIICSKLAKSLPQRDESVMAPGTMHLKALPRPTKSALYEARMALVTWPLDWKDPCIALAKESDGLYV